jgi:hypothetical protein
LVRYGPIYSQEDIVVRTFGRPQQFTVLFALETCPFNCVGLVAGKAMSEIDRQALIQQSFSHDAGEQRVLCLFKRLNGHIARDGGELPQEFVEGVTTLQIVDQVLERDSRAAEARDSVHDFRICHNYELSQLRALAFTFILRAWRRAA